MYCYECLEKIENEIKIFTCQKCKKKIHNDCLLYSNEQIENLKINECDNCRLNIENKFIKKNVQYVIVMEVNIVFING